jgi:predicted RND superfamily exporter protein
VVVVITAVTVFFVSQLHKVQMDNNFIAFLPKDNPARMVNQHPETEYGEEITILVGLERPYGTIFDGPFISRIREFFQAAGDVELVKTVNSLTQA